MNLEDIKLQSGFFIENLKLLNLETQISIIGMSGSGKDTQAKLANEKLINMGRKSAHLGSGIIFEKMSKSEYTNKEEAMFLLQTEFARSNAAEVKNSGTMLSNSFIYDVYAGALQTYNPEIVFNVGFERNFEQVQVPVQFFKSLQEDAKRRPKFFKKNILRTAIYLELEEEECRKRIKTRAELLNRPDDASDTAVDKRILRDKNEIGIVLGAMQAYGVSVMKIKCNPTDTIEETNERIFPLILQAVQIGQGLNV